MLIVPDAILILSDLIISLRTIRPRLLLKALRLLTSVTYLTPKVIQLSVSVKKTAGSSDFFVKNSRVEYK